MDQPNVSDQVQVTSVSVKLTRRVDLGFAPYIAYLKKLGKNGNPKFGTRDMSQAEMDFFMSATIPVDKLPEEVLYDLTRRANALADQVLREEFPRAFNIAAEVGVADDMFVVSSTNVSQGRVEEY